ATGDFFENVPDFGGLALDHFLGGAHGMDIIHLFEPANDEGLEQDQGHFLGQAALMELEFGTDDNDGAARVIDAFAEEVLGEAPAFERHQGAEVRRDDGKDDENHPFRTALGGLEALEQLDALGDFLANLFALGLGHGALEIFDLLEEIDAA